MRIPRTNFPPASFHDHDEADGPDDHRAREGVALRRMRLLSETAAADQPSWERHFFLAPNVRFTRTPDRDLHPEQAAHMEAVDLPADSAPSVAELREMLSTMMILQGGGSVPVSAVPPADEPVNDNAAGEPVASAGPVAAMPADAPPSPMRAATVFAELSDFAFWEALDCIPVAEMPRAEPESAPPQAEPVAVAIRRENPVPAPVTDLYRSVAIRAPHAVSPVEVRQPMPPAPVMAPAPLVAPPSPVMPAEAGWPWSRGARTAAAATPAAVEIPPVAAASMPSALAAVAEPVPEQQPAAAPAPRAAVAVSQPFRIEPVARARAGDGAYEFPPRELLQDPPASTGFVMTQEQLERNAGLLESVLEDFGIRGEIIHVRPGPVVTLYEFEPAPGVKSSRVIGLADDIARSMSALSARVAVVPGRNVIGIELPNATRETVYFGELIDTQDFSKTGYKLPLCLGKTIGGEPVIAELAKMPHLLVAGTTGSGKSVAINTMILSLLYRLTPEECRLIMVDPKMLELSVYDGIPHLLTPVVTDPKKAVLALKWAVREMEDRYHKMSRLGVRNIDGYNARAAEARERGETVTHVVQTGFEKGTGEPIHENQALDLAPMPYIVVIV
ncbi:MAG: DNA translocase FtsK, partial [Rhizobiaceae bacterium]|nr:DNA translocase FtsK [Rhizobiaceae bacterium]